MNTNLKNPYVGPRTFQREDRDLFFGRDREARDLMALVTSERLILFYAQSGAGKSSILNTCLIPELEENNFEVLPVGRIQGDVSTEIEVDNIYVYNLMSSIVQQKIDRKAYEKTSLSHFLSVLDLDESGYLFGEEIVGRMKDAIPWRRVLIIDQFEEVFTTHLDAWKKREDFFRQLAQAMKDDPLLTVILVMREDYIASLDLYAHILPGGMRTRYYMQRLTRDMALKAVRNPVEHIRPFAEGVAEKLVEDLSSIVVHKPGNVQELHSGQYVEPVQLQVVCYSLWDSLPPDGSKITEADLTEVGDVDQSLERFYDQRVESAAKEKGIPERRVREWFGDELITSARTRNMVLQNAGNNKGLRDDVIQSLRGDLVRSELRTGQIWYELSHDRLIEPILSSNAKWFEEHLSMFQRQVVLWVQQGKSESLLFRGRELDAVEKEAGTLSLTVDEQEFLEDCRILRKREQRDRTQRRVITIALIISLVLLGVAMLFYRNAKIAEREARDAENAAVTAQAKAEDEKDRADKARVDAVFQQSIAEEQRRIAEEQAQIAEDERNKALAGSLAAEAVSIKSSDHGLALLMGMEAFQREDNLLTRTTLFQLLQFSPYTRLFGFERAITSIAVSPDGRWAAVSSGDQISIMDMEMKQVVSTRKNSGFVNSLAYNNDGTLLAAGGYVANDGLISIWDVSNPKELQLLKDESGGHSKQIKSIAFSPDGKYLATGSWDKSVVLWDVSSPENMRAVDTLRELGPHDEVTSLAFSPDGKFLISGEATGKMHLWNIQDPSSAEWLQEIPAQHTQEVSSIAFDPLGGGKFASASDDKTVVLWDWDPASDSITKVAVLEGHTGRVRSIAFNEGGTILASAGYDDTVILWGVQTGERIGPALLGHQGTINTIFFGRDETTDILLSGSNDRTVILWDLSTRQPLSQPLKNAPPSGNVGPVVAGDGIQAVADGQQIILSNDAQESKTLIGHTGAVNTLSLNPQKIGDRLLLASASDDQTVILWDVTTVAEADVFLKLEGFNHPVTSAYFSGDGKLLYIESNGQVTQWTIDPAEWESLVCEIMSANLATPELKEKYQITCGSNP